MTEPQKTVKASKRKETATPTQREAETERKEPEEITLDGIKEQHPILKDLPELTAPNRLTPGQSADLSVTISLVRDAWRQMTDGSKRKDEDLDIAASMGIAYVVKKADEFFASIAIDTDSYREWGLGRVPGDLALAFIGLLVWYEGELGKSAASSTGTSEHPSN